MSDTGIEKETAQTPPMDATRPERPSMMGRPGRMAPEDSAKITRRITIMSVLVGVFLALGKVFVWQETGSVGILSSLVHSGLDLIGAVSTFCAVRYAARPPDNTYRFGRGKAESFSAVFQVCLIIFAATHLLEEVWERILEPEPITQSGFAIASMIVFLGVTLWLLIAQSWVMALWLLYTAYRVAYIAWSQLLDRELPEAERDLIKDLALQDSRVKAVQDLRTRASGPHIHIQMRLDLDDSLSLSEAHDIVVSAERRMMVAYQAADILIHPHPVGCGHTHGNVRFRSDLNI